LQSVFMCSLLVSGQTVIISLQHDHMVFVILGAFVDCMI